MIQHGGGKYSQKHPGLPIFEGPRGDEQGRCQNDEEPQESAEGFPIQGCHWSILAQGGFSQPLGAKDTQQAIGVLTGSSRSHPRSDQRAREGGSQE